MTRKVVQKTRPSFSHVRGGSGPETIMSHSLARETNHGILEVVKPEMETEMEVLAIAANKLCSNTCVTGIEAHVLLMNDSSRVQRGPQPQSCRCHNFVTSIASDWYNAAP